MVTTTVAVYVLVQTTTVKNTEQLSATTDTKLREVLVLMIGSNLESIPVVTRALSVRNRFLVVQVRIDVNTAHKAHDVYVFLPSCYGFVYYSIVPIPVKDRWDTKCRTYNIN
jgi:hypothetical protein